MTDVNENLFFREATLRICSSLNIETSMKRCYEYIRLFIPAKMMSMHILDFDQNILRFLALVGESQAEGHEQILHLPENGRREAAALWKKGEVFRIINQPNKIDIHPEILQRIGLGKNISYMDMVLELEGNQMGHLGLIADGLNQYPLPCPMHCNTRR